MKQCKNGKGYCIIEMIIYISLYAIILVSALNLDVIFVKKYKAETGLIGSYNEMSFAMSYLIDELRMADSIEIPSDNEPSALYISVTQKNESGGSATKNIKYFVDTGRNRMYRKVNGTSNLICENIESMDFSWVYNNKLLKIEIVPASEVEHSLSTLVHTRICIK